jgi:hypothetical protein
MFRLNEEKQKDCIEAMSHLEILARHVHKAWNEDESFPKLDEESGRRLVSYFIGGIREHTKSNSFELDLISLFPGIDSHRRSAFVLKVLNNAPAESLNIISGKKHHFRNAVIRTSFLGYSNDGYPSLTNQGRVKIAEACLEEISDKFSKLVNLLIEKIGRDNEILHLSRDLSLTKDGHPVLPEDLINRRSDGVSEGLSDEYFRL